MRLPILCCLLLLALSSCPARKALPQQSGLLSDDLGIGLSLLQSVSEAQSLADADSFQLKVLIADDKDQISGYEPEADRDEVIAIYYAHEPGDDVDPLAGRISDIRCFLNTGRQSSLKLLGNPIGTMGADDVEQLLGTPMNRSDIGDGQIHLTYLFDPQVEDADLQLRLITSHHLDRSCYALRLSLEHRN